MDKPSERARRFRLGVRRFQWTPWPAAGAAILALIVYLGRTGGG